jgi:hypothetical protein
VTRGVKVTVLLGLSLAGLYALALVTSLSQTRFFSIDEYQYGHATWLVAHGKLPYVDFFEHHFPGSYVLHAPFFWVDWRFETGALMLRKLVLAYLLAASALAGVGAWVATRNPYTALLSVVLPATVGFGLMSAIEYRSENFGAFTFLACLLLLEWNRRRDSARLAAFCGVLAAVAALMTQKMTFIAGTTLATMSLLDVVVRVRASSAATGRPLVAHPALVFGTAIVAGTTAIVVAGLLGILPAGFESTIVQAAEHERLYERFSIFERGYVSAFLATTWPSTVPLVGFALAHVVTKAGRFWMFPIAASLLGGALMVAPYPYNFVFLCWTVAIPAARGFGACIESFAHHYPSAAPATPLAYLFAIPVLVNQLGYVAGAVTNEHQLATLAKIETHAKPGDAVIDNAGGAMFSPDASYYFHHGAAHRVMFRDYFETQLIRDYRDSRAMFWLRDLRTKQLPAATQAYLETHYIRGDGDLHVLGFATHATETETQTQTIDVVRAGDYYVHRANPPPRDRPGRASDLLLDGTPLRTNRISLAEREYRVTVLPHSPRYLITPVESTFFAKMNEKEDPTEKRPRFSMIFQHRGSRSRASSTEPPAPTPSR